MFANVMAALTGQGKGSALYAQLSKLARRISDNRIIAGLHFPIDTSAGYVLADALAEFFVARCGGGAPKYGSRTFDGAKFRPEADVDPQRVFDPKLDERNATVTENDPPGSREKPFQIEPSPLLSALWDEAQAEMKLQGFDVGSSTRPTESEK